MDDDEDDEEEEDEEDDEGGERGGAGSWRSLPGSQLAGRMTPPSQRAELDDESVSDQIARSGLQGSGASRGPGGGDTVRGGREAACTTAINARKTTDRVQCRSSRGGRRARSSKRRRPVSDAGLAARRSARLSTARQPPDPYPRPPR